MRYLSTLLVLSFVLVTFSACNGDDGTTPVAPTYPTGKPTGVTAQANDSSATVFWNPVGGATAYYVYISENGVKFERVGDGMVTGNSLTIFELLNGKEYYFGVSAVGSAGWESSIAYPGGAPDAFPVVPEIYTGPGQDWEGNKPAPPKNLQGVAKDAAIELGWGPNEEPDFDFYKIYRLSQIGGFSSWPVIQDSVNETEFRDDDLENGREYSYRITAIDTEDLESNPSNTVALTPQDFPPELLYNVAIFMNPGRVVLEWDIPVEPDIAHYAIERVEGIDVTGAEIIVRIVIVKPVSSDPENPESDPSGFILSWVDLANGRIVVLDTAVIPGNNYTYRLSALDSANPPQEGPSFEISTPKPVF